MGVLDDETYEEIFGYSPPSSEGGSGNYFKPSQFGGDKKKLPGDKEESSQYFMPSGFGSKLGGREGEPPKPKEVKVPTPAELGEGYKALGKTFLADVGLMGTGLGELRGGALGRLSARGTQYLEDVKKRAAEVNPDAGLQSGVLTTLLPGGFALKALQGAKGIGLVGRAAGVGAGYGAAVPTGKEDLEQRLWEKGAWAALGAPVGATLGALGALGKGVASDVSAMRKPERIAPGVKEETLQRGERELAQLRDTERAERGMFPTLERDFDPLRQARLPSPDTVQNMAARTDVNSQLRTAGEIAERNAKRQQEVIGGGAFTRYEEVAKAKQVDTPFGVSPEGRQLKSYLDEVVKGGEGPLQTFSKPEINLAQEIRSELFEGRKPVDFKLVDNKLRELRQLESARTPEGATAIARERLASAADKIEESLQNWVGRENYPREAYRQASESLNRFRTKLGEALTAREEVPFGAATGVYKTPQSKVAEAIYGDPDSVRYARELLDPRLVDELGERYAVNQISGKSAAEAAAWRRNPENNFVNSVPGLSNKLDKYVETLSRRERDQLTFELVKKDFATRERLTRDLENLIADLRLADSKEVARRASNFYKKLNEENRITTDEFNRYNAQLDSLSKAYGESAEAKKRMIRNLVAIASFAGVGFSGYYGVRAVAG